MTAEPSTATAAWMLPPRSATTTSPFGARAESSAASRTIAGWSAASARRTVRRCTSGAGEAALRSTPGRSRSCRRGSRGSRNDVNIVRSSCCTVLVVQVMLGANRGVSMSYKLDLSDLKRDADTSLTQQLVDRFVAAIEADELAAGDKLPTTRALAEQAGINHLTAARVYRRLAELGYGTPSVRPGP